MRKVAGYALFSGPLDEAAGAKRFDAVCQLVSAWFAGKGAWRDNGHKTELVLHDGRVADYAASEWSTDTGKVIDHFLTEPSGTALVRTQVSLAMAGSAVIAYVELQAAGGAYQLGPMRVDIRCPKIVSTLVAAYDDWHVAEAPLSLEPFDFAGVDGGRRLEDAIWHPRRNLPVVAISSYEGRFLTEAFPREVASDLVGVALVGTVDPEAAWEVTARRGKEWSCFNGAVRLYWPGLDSRSSPLRNPLWTRLSLLSQVPTPEDAASRFKQQLRRQLLGLSAFAVPEPSELAAIRKRHADMLAEADRQALRDDNDWKGLADSYAEENTQLRAQRDEQLARVRDLEAQVANLQLSLQWKADSSAEVEPEVILPPSTVREAVDIAMDKLKDRLGFGGDVATGVAGVAADAGPPEKVLGYLEHLADMVTARRRGPLGTTAVKWLQDRGVNASGESETVKNSASERRKRTWHDGTTAREFDLHLKPTDATHPDRCVRIYFDYDEERQLGVVGWVGRHP